MRAAMRDGTLELDGQGDILITRELPYLDVDAGDADVSIHDWHYLILGSRLRDRVAATWTLFKVVWLGRFDGTSLPNGRYTEEDHPPWINWLPSEEPS